MLGGVDVEVSGDAGLLAGGEPVDRAGADAEDPHDCHDGGNLTLSRLSPLLLLGGCTAGFRTSATPNRPSAGVWIPR